MTIKLKITQVRSTAGRDKAHAAVLRGLGLRRPNRSVVVDNTPAFRGMIKKIIHMVTVEEVNV